MSAAHLLNTCPVCGAEESLDALLARMIDDAEARALIADVIAMSLPLGKDVLRYLRLHKPPRQRLRLATARKLLAELVPDMRRAAIERHGRVWALAPESWRLALDAVFANVERGAVTLPLEGNGYLYAVITRMADKAEAADEKAHEAGLRGRACQSAGVSPGDALPRTPPRPAPMPAPAPQAPPDPETKARAEAARARAKAMVRRPAVSGAEPESTTH